jgi:hypothetical protein
VIRSENEKLAKEKETGEKAVETTAKLREEMAKIKVQIYDYCDGCNVNSRTSFKWTGVPHRCSG